MTDTEPTEEWIANEQIFQIELPEDKQDLELEYILNETLASPQNIGEAISKCLSLGLEGLIPEAEVEAVEDSFQDNVESKQKDASTLKK